MKDLLENIGMTYKSPYPRFVAIPHVKPASDMLLSVDRNSAGSTVDYATRATVNGVAGSIRTSSSPYTS